MKIIGDYFAKLTATDPPAGLDPVRRPLALPRRLVVSVSVSIHLPASAEPALGPRALRSASTANAGAEPSAPVLEAATGGQEWCAWVGRALIRRLKEHGGPADTESRRALLTFPPLLFCS